MIQESITFLNSNGETLHGIIRVPEGEGKFPAVILCHGFASNKNHELMFGLWDMISRARFVCLRFDFTGHGESQGTFKEFTVSQEVRDVRSAVEFLKKSGIVDEKKIALVGFSLGASVALLASVKEKIKCVVKIAGIARLEDFIKSKFSKHQIKEWKKKGFIQFHNFDELSIEVLNDIHRHDVLPAVKEIKCPLLIVHGTHDSLVPFENAREIFNHANHPKQLELIDDAEHFFQDDKHREQLYDVVVGFLLRFLR